MNTPTLVASALILIAGLTLGCGQPPVSQEDSIVEELAESSLARLQAGDVEIIEIEGCEYIVYEKRQTSAQGYGFMTHKGNCKNPIHIYRDPVSARFHPNREIGPLAGGGSPTGG